MALDVLGLGSWLGCDDAIGLHLVEALGNDPAVGTRCRTMPSPDFAELTELFAQAEEPILLVDCARLGRDPGEFAFLGPGQMRLLHDDSVSTHGLGIAQALDLSRALGSEPDVSVMGIEPFSLAPSRHMSDLMVARFDALLGELRQHVRTFVRESQHSAGTLG